MVEGRSKKVFATWLDQRPQAWRDRIQIVAMDGFTGFKTAAAEKLPDAVEVMDPFHVVQLGGDTLDQLPATRPTRNPRPPRPLRRPALWRPPHPAHRNIAAHQQAEDPTGDPVRRRGPRCRRNHLEGLPRHRHRLPEPRPQSRTAHPQQGHRQHRPRRSRRADRAPQARLDPEPPRRRRAGLLRPSPHIQRPHRSHQRPTRTPPRLSPRLPEPDQLHRPQPARDRRIQTPTTPWIVKSHFARRLRAIQQRCCRSSWPLTHSTSLGDSLSIFIRAICSFHATDTTH